MYIYSTYNIANLFLANHLEKNYIIIPDGYFNFIMKFIPKIFKHFTTDILYWQRYM